MQLLLVVQPAAFACGPEPAFERWPALAESTLGVVVAVECSGALSVRLSPRAELLASPLRLEGCERGSVSLLEYPTTLEEHGLEPGPLPPDSTQDCGVVRLPRAARTHHLPIAPDTELEFSALDPGEAHPGALAEFKTRQRCPCRPLRRAGVLEVGAARTYQVEHDGGGGAWIFGVSRAQVQVFRSLDLETATLVVSSSVATGPNPSGRDPESGVKDVARGADGTFYLGGELGRIYEFSEREGWQDRLRVPSEAAVFRLAVNQDEGPLELFALLSDNSLWRLAEGRWSGYGQTFQGETRSSQRPGLAWLGRGRAAGMPDRGEGVFYVDADELHRFDWLEAGSLHAMASLPGLGLVAGTRDTRVFVADPADPAAARLLLGPSGASADPTRAWFQKFRSLPEGFIASLDGPDSFLEFSWSWGYCPQQHFESEHVNLTRFDVVGDRVLGGGGNEGVAAEGAPVELPVFEWE